MANRPVPRQQVGEFRVRRVGRSLRRYTDVYHFTLSSSWVGLISSMFGLYMAVSLLFAGLYWLDPGGIGGADPGNLLHALWFSVQTLSTIGYGSMSPESVYVNALVIVESFVGLGGVAVSAGLLYAKFSRPTARVVFSEPFVVLTRNGRPCLMFRMANERASHIVEARLTLTALLDEVTDEGQTMRRLVDIYLERSESPMFLLSWTAIHYLDADSPIAFLAEGRWDPSCMGLLVSLTGMEAGFSQQVHVRTTYTEKHARFNHDFVDMVRTDPDGTIELNVSRIHDVVPLE